MDKGPASCVQIMSVAKKPFTPRSGHLVMLVAQSNRIENTLLY